MRLPGQRGAERTAQELPGVALVHGGNLAGRAGRDHAPAAVAAFRTEVDDPVGGLDHLQVVLDHHHRVAALHQRVQHLQELAHVVEVEARRGLVEDVEGAPGGAARELLGELDPLRFPARERGRLLAHLDVAEADALQGFQLVADCGHSLEESRGIVHGHRQHVRDGLVAVQDLQRLAVVAPALALLALDVDVRQEVHLDLDQAVALAGLAAPALDVEGEAPRLVAAGLGLREPGVPLADRAEGAGVGGRVGARRAADGRLVDVHHLVEELEPVDAVVGAGLDPGREHAPRGGPVEGIDYQRGLAAAGDTGDAGEGAEAKGNVDGGEVVGPRAAHRDPLPLLAGPRGLRHRDRLLPAQVLAGQALPARDDGGRLAFGHDLAAVDARTRSHVHDIVRTADRVLVMLDHEHGVAKVAQVAQRAEQARVVALMQANGGLVQHVEHARSAPSRSARRGGCADSPRRRACRRCARA